MAWGLLGSSNPAATCCLCPRNKPVLHPAMLLLTMWRPCHRRGPGSDSELADGVNADCQFLRIRRTSASNDEQEVARRFKIGTHRAESSQQPRCCLERKIFIPQERSLSQQGESSFPSWPAQITFGRRAGRWCLWCV